MLICDLCVYIFTANMYVSSKFRHVKSECQSKVQFDVCMSPLTMKRVGLSFADYSRSNLPCG